MKHMVIGALALGFSAACSRTQVETTIRTDLIGSKYARVTGYMATVKAAPGGRSTETTPSDIGHDVIRDEATLARVTPSDTCIDIVLRTERGRDEPIEQLSPKISIDGQTQRAIVENELVSVTDYNFMGRVQTLAVEGIAARQYTSMEVTEPAEKVFRVVTRRATVCAPVGGNPKQVKLALTHPYWSEADWKYHLDFMWKLTPGQAPIDAGPAPVDAGPATSTMIGH